MGFVALFQTAQDRHRVFNTGFTDENLLETALQGSVLLDVLAVFLERGGANQAQFAAGQHRFQHIGGCDRSFSATSTHQRVEFINKCDDLALGIIDLFQDCFEALFKLTPILRASNQGRHVQGNQLLSLERVRNVSGNNSLGKSLNHSGLPHTGFTDQHGVIFGAAGEHLRDPSDLRIATDHRIEFSFPSDVGQVHSILLQSAFLLFLLRVTVRHC